jgi:hypothetical protein
MKDKKKVRHLALQKEDKEKNLKYCIFISTLFRHSSMAIKDIDYDLWCILGCPNAERFFKLWLQYMTTDC